MMSARRHNRLRSSSGLCLVAANPTNVSMGGGLQQSRELVHLDGPGRVSPGDRIPDHQLERPAKPRVFSDPAAVCNSRDQWPVTRSTAARGARETRRANDVITCSTDLRLGCPHGAAGRLFDCMPWQVGPWVSAA